MPPELVIKPTIPVSYGSCCGPTVFAFWPPFAFTAQSKSRLAFDLLAAVNSGRVKMYAADGSPEFQEFCVQRDQAMGHLRANQTMNFYVDPGQGHDDFLMSLALLVKASEYQPRSARGRIAV